MDIRIDEIADGIYRFSTFVAAVAPPAGFTFNQYLITADEPLLFHCGQRHLFPHLSAAVMKVLPLKRLRWIGFGHVEADESGAMNQWLAAAPAAEVVHGAVACSVQLNDLADRPPRPLAHGETLDLGGKRVRWIDTPHVPHAWESGLIYEETTRTLFTGDLFTHIGDGPAITTDSIVAPAIATEEAFHSTSLAPSIGRTVRGLAALAPRRLAVMHGSCFEGDGGRELEALAAYYDGAVLAAVKTA